MKKIRSPEKCFLCHTILTNGINKEDEHIFDKALLRYLNLFDKEIRFPNGDYFKYSQSKIPCCASCNKNKLKPVWDRVFCTIKKGPDSVRNDLSKSDLYVWLAKVYYGLLIRDTKTKLDKKQQDSDKIASDEQVTKNTLLRYMIDVLREDSDDNLVPGSIFIYDCELTAQKQFWFIDTLDPAYISIKVNNILIVAYLHDFNIVSNIKFAKKITKEDLNNHVTVHDLHTPIFAKEMTLNHMEAIELSIFYATVAHLLYPMEVYLYPSEGRLGYKFIGKRTPQQPPLKEWNHETYMWLRKENGLPKLPLIIHRYISNLRKPVSS